MIYFDSAATSFQKPASVAAAMWEALASMSSPGRGGYPAAARAADTAFQCRSELAEMFGLKNPEQVVFTLNATHALNIAIKSLVPPGGRAVVSGYEHNAVTRPLEALGAKITVAATPLFDSKAVTDAFDRLVVPGTDAVVAATYPTFSALFSRWRKLPPSAAAEAFPLLSMPLSLPGSCPWTWRH